MRWEANRLHRPAECLMLTWNKSFFCCFLHLQLVIPLTTQDDLDKAVELLDRSVHMKSLKILLVLQNLSQVSRFTPTNLSILMLRFVLSLYTLLRKFEDLEEANLSLFDCNILI